jgi:hypothetical protein
MPRPAGRKARRHANGTPLATLYAEVDPSVKEFFGRVAKALSITTAEAVEVVVRRLQPPDATPEWVPEWVLQRVAEEQLVVEEPGPRAVAA